MNDKIKQKIDKFVKAAFWISILFIILSGIIKATFKVDWFDLEVSKGISSFFLFKNQTSLMVIAQLSLMFNYAIIISIANKAELKDVVKKMWYLLILTYLVNFLSREVVFILTPVIGLVINVIYILIKKQPKMIIKSSFRIIIISVGLLLYQYVTIIVRLNHFPLPSDSMGNYEQLVYVIDMYILALLLYRYSMRGGVWNDMVMVVHRRR